MKWKKVTKEWIEEKDRSMIRKLSGWVFCGKKAIDSLISLGSSEKNVKKKHSIPIEAFLLSHCMLLRSKIKKNKANYANKHAALTNQPIKGRSDRRTYTVSYNSTKK